MGKLDILAKEYIKRPSVFADVFNQFLYHGRQVIDPVSLMELDSTETAVPYGTDGATIPEQRYRDVSKMLVSMTDGMAAYCILAVENEAKINYSMPVKNGLYDFLQLAHQVTTAAASHRKQTQRKDRPSRDEFLSGFWKSDRLLPVMTVVIYFGAEEWDGPLSLKEMYADCSEEILKYTVDYHINLITPKGLEDREINEFRTGMREIMKYIKYSDDKKKLNELIKSEQRFKSVERSAVEIINTATNSNMRIEERRELIDVCLAIQEMREESRMEGEIKGVISFAKELGIPQEEVKKSFMKKYEKNDAEAEELIKIYWK